MKVTDWRIDSPLEDCSRMEHSSRGTNPGAPLRKGGGMRSAGWMTQGGSYTEPLSLISTALLIPCPTSEVVETQRWKLIISSPHRKHIYAQNPKSG